MLKKIVSVMVFMACFAANAKQEVNVYSYRQPFLVEPLFKKFTDKTGVQVNVVFAKNGMVERLKREGKHSPADILLTNDISRLVDLHDSDLLQEVTSVDIEQAIPTQYRAADNKWFALTTRVRNIYSAKRLGDIDFNYEDLAKPEWKGRICTRSGKHIYNVALIASMIAEHGEADTLTWLEGVKSNLARKPQGNDRSQVQAINQELCDVSLGNSYYFGNMLQDEKQKFWADSVNINFPNQNNRGAHVNVSGMGMAKHAPNAENAKALMEFLVSVPAQELYAETNMEYPVREGVKVSDIVASWGKFSADKLPLEALAQHRKTALMLLDKVKFDL